MKRIAIIMLLLSPLLAAAQNDDEIVSSSPDLNVSTAPQAPKAIPATTAGRSLASDDCSRFFMEGTCIFGSDYDAGIGLNFTWLPEHWGAYGSFNVLERSSILTCGVAFRPIAHPKFLDCQFFVGPAICDAVGFEAGMRLSATYDVNHGPFSWWSASLSRIFINSTTYYTIGVSVNIGALFTWIIW